eukprot:4648935-Prymnesium_polylepis.2
MVEGARSWRRSVCCGEASGDGALQLVVGIRAGVGEALLEGAPELVVLRGIRGGSDAGLLS